MRVLRKVYGCPVELAVDLLAGKWKTVILARLKDEPLRYGSLRRLIPRISDKVLTERLRELEEMGLVDRIEGAAGSGPSRYALSERARGLKPALEALYSLGNDAGSAHGVRWLAP